MADTAEETVLEQTQTQPQGDAQIETNTEEKQLDTQVNEENKPAEAQQTIVTEQTAATVQETQISDEELLKQIEARTGRKLGALDELKPEPDAEAKRKIEFEGDKKLMDKAVAKGKSINEFVEIKKVANITEAEYLAYGKYMATQELIKEGATPEEAEELVAEKYQVLTDAEKQDATEAEIKRSNIAEKLLSRKGSELKDKAAAFINSLQGDIDNEIQDSQLDAKLSATVVDYASKTEKKITIELGEFGDQKLKLTPVEYVVDDSVIAEITATLKDKSSREKLFYNEDGTENVELLFDLLKKKHIFESAIKAAVVQHVNEQVEIVTSKFGTHPTVVAPKAMAATSGSNGTGKAIEGTGKITHRASSPTPLQKPN